MTTTTHPTYVQSFAQAHALLPAGPTQEGAQDTRWWQDNEFVSYAVLRVNDDAQGSLIDVQIAHLRNGEPDKEQKSWIILRKERLGDFRPMRGDTLWIYQQSIWGYPRGKVFWHVAKQKGNPPFLTTFVYDYRTVAEVQRDAALADAARREQKIRTAAERAAEFAERTSLLPASFQEKIAHDRDLDPVGYAVDFEGTMLDIYEVATEICAFYTQASTSKDIAAKNIRTALPETIWKRVRHANVLERPQVYEAMALAHELLTQKLPDWATKTSEEP